MPGNIEKRSISDNIYRGYKTVDNPTTLKECLNNLGWDIIGRKMFSARNTEIVIIVRKSGVFGHTESIEGEDLMKSVNDFINARGYDAVAQMLRPDEKSKLKFESWKEGFWILYNNDKLVESAEPIFEVESDDDGRVDRAALVDYCKNFGDFLFVYKYFDNYRVMCANANAIVDEIVGEVRIADLSYSHDVDYLMKGRSDLAGIDWRVVKVDDVPGEDAPYYIVVEY